MTLDKPSAPSGNDKNDIYQLYTYICKLVDRLNMMIEEYNHENIRK